MAQTTNFHEPVLPQAATPTGESLLDNLWSRILLVITRSIFWAYERGSWQYDVIVAFILAFIFFTPRGWFNDRPTFQMTELRHWQGVVEMSRVNKDVRYLVDARLVGSFAQKPEDAIPIILKQHLPKTFTVKSIDVVRDRQQVILGYTVLVEE